MKNTIKELKTILNGFSTYSIFVIKLGLLLAAISLSFSLAVLLIPSFGLDTFRKIEISEALFASAFKTISLSVIVALIADLIKPREM